MRLLALVDQNRRIFADFSNSPRQPGATPKSRQSTQTDRSGHNPSAGALKQRAPPTSLFRKLRPAALDLTNLARGLQNVATNPASMLKQSRPPVTILRKRNCKQWPWSLQACPAACRKWPQTLRAWRSKANRAPARFEKETAKRAPGP